MTDRARNGAFLAARLLMAAALPQAFGEHGVLFAVSYVALQVGRNVAAAGLLRPDHALRDVFERLLEERCTVTRREELPGGTRTLYVGVRRG